jgi:hypothetical protein
MAADLKPDTKNKQARIRREERNSELLAPTDVLQSLFKDGKHPLSDQFLRWKIWAQWEEVVGPSFSKNCLPVGFNNGNLNLWVKSASWLQEMRFLLDDIRSRVNQYVGHEWVVTIRLTLDRHQVPTEEGAALFREFVQKNSTIKKNRF